MLWPVLSHGAALADRPDLMRSITACVVVVVAIALCVAARDARVRMAWLAIAAATLVLWQLAPALLLFLPPAALNVAFGWFFANTLRAGREPRIATFARLERGESLPPELVLYTRRLTWMWTILLFALAVTSLVLAFTAPLRVWSFFVNVASYVAIAGLFTGEYVYRRIRYRNHRHGSLVGLIRIVVRDRRAMTAGTRAP